MTLVWATAVLLAALPFLLWPLLRHEDAFAHDEAAVARRARGLADAERQAALLAIEEVELDEASGRLDPAEATRRLADLRRDAERILQRS